jgi:hypothetical protein
MKIRDRQVEQTFKPDGVYGVTVDQNALLTKYLETLGVVGDRIVSYNMSKTFAEKAECLIQYARTDIERRAQALKDFKEASAKIVEQQSQTEPTGAGRIVLNDGQQAALNDMLEWVLQSKEPFYVLRGFAGTGKSFLVGSLLATMKRNQVLLTSPTNEATKLLRKANPGFDARTIYSALSLKMVQREDELVLTPSPERLDLRKYLFVVVDEASMLNSEVMGYIESTVRRYPGVRFLLIGDEAQLRPVGERVSPVWKLDVRGSQLLKVVRHDNQILTAVTQVRRCIMERKRLRRVDIGEADVKSVWRLSSEGFERRLRKFAASGGDFTETKAVAWRNKTVDRLNQIVREERFSYEEREKGFWLPTDLVVVTSPIEQEGHIVATVSENGIVETSTIGTDQETKLNCYFLGVKFDNRTLRLRVVHESSMSDLSERLAELAYEARNKDSKKWREFWWLKNRFHEIRHAYALTVHRSQGSTFKNVFADAGDILANPELLESYQCLYVGMSRASEKLFVTGLP